MKEGPDIALIGALIGDPARANMLLALIGGRALTAGELAAVAGVTPQTASTHLRRLEEGGLIRQRRQGRHRYMALADDEVGRVLEGMIGLAASRGHHRVRTGPSEPALRHARVCYDHLAGEMGVRLYDGLVTTGRLVLDGDTPVLTGPGAAFMADFGIDLPRLRRARRPLCRACLDWSARRPHLAGSLGAALLEGFYARGWARRQTGSRAVVFTREGEAAFEAEGWNAS
ncbi:MAG: helix-turn-helix transcriptional regulator [Geminicoccaceae bacterium]|nr:helix-turn-helix transcriptional regulator [Geminicoccaceae bacterium]